MKLITAQNLPTILTIVISANGLYLLREVFKNLRLWRKGVSDHEREAVGFVASQLEKCNDDLTTVMDERDQWRQKSGRRDHIILANGLDLPHDGTNEPVRNT